MSDAKSPNDETLTIRDHLDPDKHWIGETLPAGSLNDMAPSIGSVNAVGVSPFPARIDHTHSVTASGLFVAKSGDTMTGNLWVPALYVYNTNPGVFLYDAAGSNRYGYLWADSTTAQLILGVEAGAQLAFVTGNVTRETIDVSGNHWWTGSAASDAMVFNRANQILQMKGSSSGEALQIRNGIGYISFWNAAASVRMCYLQATTTGVNLSSDVAGSTINFLVGGGAVVGVSTTGGVQCNSQVASNFTPNTLVWDRANFRAYHTSGTSTDQARLSLVSGSVAPQLRSVQANGERLGVVNSNCSGYAPIEASSFPVSSSIKTKKNVRSISCKLFKDRKVDHHPLLDTVPEPDIMSLRPIAFRHKIGPQMIERINPDKEIDIDDPKSWKIVPRDPKTPLGIDGFREKLGMVAEEVQIILPSAVSMDENGDAVGIDYAQVTVALLSHVQQLTEEVSNLRNRVVELESV